jgi:hypothetical protein
MRRDVRKSGQEVVKKKDDKKLARVRMQLKKSKWDIHL